MDLIEIVKIAAVLALIAFVVLAAYLMVTMNKAIKLVQETNDSLNKLSTEFTKSLNDISKDVNELKSKIINSLSNVDILTNQLSTTSKKIEAEADAIFNLFEPMHKLIHDIHQRIAPPLTKEIGRASCRERV